MFYLGQNSTVKSFNTDNVETRQIVRISDLLWANYVAQGPKKTVRSKELRYYIKYENGTTLEPPPGSVTATALRHFVCEHVYVCKISSIEQSVIVFGCRDCRWEGLTLPRNFRSLQTNEYQLKHLVDKKVASDIANI